MESSQFAGTDCRSSGDLFTRKSAILSLYSYHSGQGYKRSHPNRRIVNSKQRQIPLSITELLQLKYSTWLIHMTAAYGLEPYD